jgi:hypothetical protein
LVAVRRLEGICVDIIKKLGASSAVTKSRQPVNGLKGITTSKFTFNILAKNIFESLKLIGFHGKQIAQKAIGYMLFAANK